MAASALLLDLFTKVVEGWFSEVRLSLHLASHQVLKSPRALEGPDLAKATNRSVVHEDVGHRLAPREVLQPRAQLGVGSRVYHLEVVTPAL